MKYLAFATFVLMLVASASTANAAETKCKGDALRKKPPIPNHPTHIRNVVWRNMRAMCLQELSQMPKPPAASNIPSAQPSSSN